jgi:hypothetical protein
VFRISLHILDSLLNIYLSQKSSSPFYKHCGIQTFCGDFCDMCQIFMDYQASNFETDVELICWGFVQRQLLSSGPRTGLSGHSTALICREIQHPLRVLTNLMLLEKIKSELTHMHVYLAPHHTIMHLSEYIYQSTVTHITAQRSIDGTINMENIGRTWPFFGTSWLYLHFIESRQIRTADQDHPPIQRVGTARTRFGLKTVDVVRMCSDKDCVFFCEG